MVLIDFCEAIKGKKYFIELYHLLYITNVL